MSNAMHYFMAKGDIINPGPSLTREERTPGGVLVNGSFEFYGSDD